MSLLLAFLAAPGFAAGSDSDGDCPETLRVGDLQAHVRQLASPEFLGRRGPGAARAAGYVADAFARAGLKPAFGDSFFQPIPSKLDGGANSPASYLGRNVGAVIAGSDPRLKDEWVLLSAHFDHVGVKDGRLYPGADDNASGVAMLIEVARKFAVEQARPKRTVLFAAFDLEETGLLGSTHFAAHPPLPFRSLKAVLTADMLGRSMANVMDEYVFVLGSETSPQLRSLVQEVVPGKGLTVGRLGADLIGTRSDYGPFRDRKVPFLFFSTGQSPDYHRPTDTPDRVDYAKLQRCSAWIASVFARLADVDVAPIWDDHAPLTDMDEVRTVLVLVRRVLSRPDLYHLTDKKRELVDGVESRLDRIVRSKEVTVDDRSWLLWSARMLLASVF